jgi:disulfide bond formation protein DsbB
LARAVAIPAIVPAAVPAAQSNDQAVLGTQTEKDSGVKGASDKLAAIAPTENGWKLFGIVWYWWLLILAAIALFVWRVVAWVRREDDVLPA